MFRFPCYVINLDQFPDRLSLMRQQLDSLDINYQRIPAVDGSTLSSEEVALWLSPLRYLLKGRSFTPGQVGCWLTHRAIWQRMIEQNIPWALILEDDVLLDERLPHVVSALAQNGADYDVVQLFYQNRHKRKFAVVDMLGGGVKLVNLRGKTNGGQAYLLRRSGAEKLLKFESMMFCNDDWEWHEALTGLRRRGVRPHLASPAPIASAINAVDSQLNLSRRAYKKTIVQEIHKLLVEPVLSWALAFMSLKWKAAAANPWVREPVLFPGRLQPVPAAGPGKGFIEPVIAPEGLAIDDEGR